MLLVRVYLHIGVDEVRILTTDQRGALEETTGVEAEHSHGQNHEQQRHYVPVAWHECQCDEESRHAKECNGVEHANLLAVVETRDLVAEDAGEHLHEELEERWQRCRKSDIYNRIVQHLKADLRSFMILCGSERLT